MKRLLGGLAGVLSGVLPAVGCPACWPAYTSALSALGIGFVGFGTGHLLLVTAMAAVAFGMLLLDWRRHRYMGPLVPGLIGCTCIIGASVSASPPVVAYAGSAALLVAATWNGLLVRRTRKKKTCTAHGCSQGEVSL